MPGLDPDRIEREAQIVLDVVVAGIDACRVRELRELIDERRIKLPGMTAVVAIARTGVEQRVTTDQRGRVRVSARR